MIKSNTNSLARLPARLATCFRNAAITALFVALPFSAEATDGVAEINHTCAVQTGCFSGDSAGYPITIDGQAGRSYRLTSDLIVPDENTDGIRVSTSDVGIDLNNFSIIRSGCEGANTNCTPASGFGSGIERTASSHRGISVKNGSITGMGSYGVLLGQQAEVTRTRVRWNRLAGIFVDSGSIITGNTAYQNGDDGIHANVGSTVSENTAIFNTGDGIFVGSGSMVQGNTVFGNTGYGISLNVNAAYRENVITSNFAGTVFGGVNMGGNACSGSTTCP